MTPIDLESRRAERLPELELGQVTAAVFSAQQRLYRAEVENDRALDAYIEDRSDENGDRWLTAQDELDAALNYRARAVAEMRGQRWLRVVREEQNDGR